MTQTDQISINISSAQFALSNFTNLENGESFKSLNEILISFRNKPNSWLEIECLFHTNDETQVLYGLIILIDLIKYKWNSITSEQQHTLTTFITGKTLKLATVSSLTNTEEVILRKFNQCFIELFIVKWSRNECDNLIPDLIQSCHSNEYLCQNNLLIIRQLFEIVFINDQSLGLVTDKLDSLKSHLNSLFDKVAQLLLLVIDISKNVIIIQRCFELLELFLHLKFDLYRDWDKIFSHLSSLLLVSVVRRECMRTMLVFLKHTKSQTKVVDYYKTILEQLIKIIPNSIVLKDSYQSLKPPEQSFLGLMADMLAEYTPLLYAAAASSNLSPSAGPYAAAIPAGVGSSTHLEDAWLFIMRLTAVDERDIQTICYEYWSQLSSTLCCSSNAQSPDHSGFVTKATVYLSEVANIILTTNCPTATNNGLLTSSAGKLLVDTSDSLYQSMQNTYRKYFVLNPKVCLDQIRLQFTQLLSLPSVPIRQLFSVSRCLHFVLSSDLIGSLIPAPSSSHHTSPDLHPPPAASPASSLQGVSLSAVVSATIPAHSFNSSGGVSVSMVLDTVRYCLNSLLSLQSQMLTYRDQLPVCASSLYIIGATAASPVAHYHPGLAAALVRRLTQFLMLPHTTAPSANDDDDLLKDMALESLHKWSLTNQQYFLATTMPGDTSCLARIINDLGVRIVHLSPHQIPELYGSLANIISATKDPQQQEKYGRLLFSVPNKTWRELLEALTDNCTLLLNSGVLHSLRLIIQVNIRVCAQLKTCYLVQLSEIFPSFLNLLQLLSVSLSKISQKLCKNWDFDSHPGAKDLISLQESIHELIQTVLVEITWTSETYTELCEVLVPLLVADYGRCMEPRGYVAVVTSLRQVLEAGEPGQSRVVSMVTGLLPPPSQAVFGVSGRSSSTVATVTSALCAMLLLLRSLVRRHVPVITTSSLLPFVNLIYLIDFVLWALTAVCNETRQLSYSIIETILQHYESDRVNSHQRKKFIRQFYIQILQTVVLSALDGVRVPEEDGFTRVVRTLGRWLSSSLLSFRLVSSRSSAAAVVSGDGAPERGGKRGTVAETNREAVLHSVVQLLSAQAPDHEASLHSNLVLGLLRSSAASATAINDTIRNYRVLTSQLPSLPAAP